MDRFDICGAYYLLEVYYNKGGWLRQRPSNQRRMEATHVQLHRMGFKPGIGLGYSSLSPTARELYHELERRYGFEYSGVVCPECDNGPMMPPAYPGDYYDCAACGHSQPVGDHE